MEIWMMDFMGMGCSSTQNHQMTSFMMETGKMARWMAMEN